MSLKWDNLCLLFYLKLNKFVKRFNTYLFLVLCTKNEQFWLGAIVQEYYTR